MAKKSKNHGHKPSPFDIKPNKPSKRVILGNKVWGIERDHTKTIKSIHKEKNLSTGFVDERVYKGIKLAKERPTSLDALSRVETPEKEQELLFQRLRLLREREIRQRKRLSRNLSKRKKKTFVLADSDNDYDDGDGTLGAEDIDNGVDGSGIYLTHAGKRIDEMDDKALRTSAVALISQKESLDGLDESSMEYFKDLFFTGTSKGGHKSRKEILKEIVKRSKEAKAEHVKDAEEQRELLMSLDAQFAEAHAEFPILKNNSKQMYLSTLMNKYGDEAIDVKEKGNGIPAAIGKSDYQDDIFDDKDPLLLGDDGSAGSKAPARRPAALKILDGKMESANVYDKIANTLRFSRRLPAGERLMNEEEQEERVRKKLMRKEQERQRLTEEAEAENSDGGWSLVSDSETYASGNVIDGQLSEEQVTDGSEDHSDVDSDDDIGDHSDSLSSSEGEVVKESVLVDADDIRSDGDIPHAPDGHFSGPAQQQSSAPSKIEENKKSTDIAEMNIDIQTMRQQDDGSKSLSKTNGDSDDRVCKTLFDDILIEPLVTDANITTHCDNEIDGLINCYDSDSGLEFSTKTLLKNEIGEENLPFKPQIPTTSREFHRTFRSYPPNSQWKLAKRMIIIAGIGDASTKKDIEVSFILRLLTHIILSSDLNIRKGEGPSPVALWGYLGPLVVPLLHRHEDEISRFFCPMVLHITARVYGMEKPLLTILQNALQSFAANNDTICKHQHLDTKDMLALVKLLPLPDCINLTRAASKQLAVLVGSLSSLDLSVLHCLLGCYSAERRDNAFVQVALFLMGTAAEREFKMFQHDIVPFRPTRAQEIETQSKRIQQEMHKLRLQIGKIPGNNKNQLYPKIQEMEDNLERLYNEKRNITRVLDVHPFTLRTDAGLGSISTDLKEEIELLGKDKEIYRRLPPPVPVTKTPMAAQLFMILRRVQAEASFCGQGSASPTFFSLAVSLMHTSSAEIYRIANEGYLVGKLLAREEGVGTNKKCAKRRLLSISSNNSMCALSADEETEAMGLLQQALDESAESGTESEWSLFGARIVESTYAALSDLASVTDSAYVPCCHILLPSLPLLHELLLISASRYRTGNSIDSLDVNGESCLDCSRGSEINSLCARLVNAERFFRGRSQLLFLLQIRRLWRYSLYIASKPLIPYPSSRTEAQAKGIALLTPRYFPVESLKKVLRAVGNVTSDLSCEMHEKRMMQKQYKQQRRSAALSIRHSAAILNMEYTQNKELKRDAVKSRQRALETILQKDQEEYKAMRTQGGGMDTSFQAYRPSKKQKLKRIGGNATSSKTNGET